MAQRPRIPNEQPEEPVSILLVSPSAEDRLRLSKIIDHPNWLWRYGTGCRQVETILRERTFAVVLCENRLPDGCWRDVLDITARLNPAPNVIVFSHLADEAMWAEVLNLGGFDLLMKPFIDEEVLRVSLAAVHSWDLRRSMAEARRAGTSGAGRAANFPAA